ncbi:hypothetical protein [Lysinibacillus sphaericus]|nr:hypothetical protein [Lysinibacillus sphaericus]
MSPPTSNRSKPQGLQEIVPEWFNERNEDNSEISESKRMRVGLKK